MNSVRGCSFFPFSDIHGWWFGRDEDYTRLLPLPHLTEIQSICLTSIAIVMKSLQFSVMDVSVRTTMKGAAKCDKHCELQNSVSRQGPERILCFWDIPKSICASVPFYIDPKHITLLLN